MARRRTRAKTTRRRASKAVNAVGVAEGMLLANAVTKGFFGTNLVEFITGFKDGQFKSGADGSYRLSLPELAGFTTSGFNPTNIGGRYGSGLGFGDAVRNNLKENAGSMVTTLIVAPILFKAGSKLLSKPRSQANKLLKMSGIGSMVKV